MCHLTTRAAVIRRRSQSQICLQTRRSESHDQHICRSHKQCRSGFHDQCSPHLCRDVDPATRQPHDPSGVDPRSSADVEPTAGLSVDTTSRADADPRSRAEVDLPLPVRRSNTGLLRTSTTRPDRVSIPGPVRTSIPRPPNPVWQSIPHPVRTSISGSFLPSNPRPVRMRSYEQPIPNQLDSRPRDRCRHWIPQPLRTLISNSAVTDPTPRQRCSQLYIGCAGLYFLLVSASGRPPTLLLGIIPSDTSVSRRMFYAVRMEPCAPRGECSGASGCHHATSVAVIPR